MILVVGGTGFIGSKVVELLMEQQQHDVRVVARGRSDWESSVLPRFRRHGVEVMVGDILDRKFCDKALNGCKAVVNCSGMMRGDNKNTVEEINVTAVENLVRLGQERQIQRFIHLSCLGATEHSTCRYMRAKWQAENLVRTSSFYWTVFRPSIIFGAGSQLSKVLNFWVGRTPIIVVVGSGLNKMQPISGDDVANCISQSIYNRDTVGKTFDLMGPESIDLKEMLTMTAQQEGRNLQVLRIPSFIGVRIAAMMGKLNPSCPIDGEVMRVLTSDLVTDPDEPIGEIFEMKALPYSASFKHIENEERKKNKSSSVAGKSSKKKRRSVDEDEDEDEEEDDDEE